MRMRRLVGSAALVVATLFSCGPFLPEAVFTPDRQPSIPLDQFSRGKLGVIEPGFKDRYLIIAYRALIGNPVSLEARPEPPSGPSMPAPGRWLAYTRALRGAQTSLYIATDRHIPGEQWQTYENCLDNAFDTAISTLDDRLRRFGRDDTLKWLRAQDTVFQNCSEGQHIPDPPESGLPALLRADREYQVAAAYFYSGQFPQAREAFTRVADDNASPWHEIAPYLVARAWLREGTLTNNRDALLRGRAALEKLGDRGKPLLGYIDARLEPDRVYSDLSGQLLTAKPAEFKQQLLDWQMLRDRGAKSDSELLRWIDAVHTRQAVPGDSGPALVASLMSATRLDPSLDHAAADVKPDSPAYPTVLYHRIRLMPPDAARRLLDRVLPDIERSQPLSALNLFRTQRFALSRDLSEFVRFAPRYDVSEPGRVPLFDEDSTRVMNRLLPVEQLAVIAHSRELPDSLRRQLTGPVWVRMVMLGQHDAAVRAAEQLAYTYPELTPALKRYREEKTGYAAALVMLGAPGLRPAVRPGFPREDPLTKLNNIRDNWWCDLSGRHPFWNAPQPPPSPAAPAFVTEAEAAAGRSEVERIEALGRAPNYLGSVVVNWARLHPDDASVPEALHKVVRATRYGCTDERTGAVSRAAFDLLHKRYPDNEWTKKTPYWFGGP